MLRHSQVQLLETLIHEVLHATDYTLPEVLVDKYAKNLTLVLFRLGVTIDPDDIRDSD